MYEDSDEGEDRVLDPDYKQPSESDSTEGTNPFTNYRRCFLLFQSILFCVQVQVALNMDRILCRKCSLSK